MILENIIFYFLSVCLVFFALLAIKAKNKIRGVLFLVPFVCSLSGLIITLGFEFVGLALVFVDLSSICVIAVLVIMIEDKDIYYDKTLKKVVAFFMVSLLVVLIINVLILALGLENSVPKIDNDITIFSFKELAKSLFYHNSFLFKLSGVILFCGATGAIMLVYAVEGLEPEKIAKSKIKNQKEVELVKIISVKEASKL